MSTIERTRTRRRSPLAAPLPFFVQGSVIDRRLTVTEAAAACSYHRSTFSRWVARVDSLAAPLPDGRFIRSVRNSAGRYRIPESEVRRFNRQEANQ